MSGDQIFISHSSEDNACAKQVYEDLLNAGYWVWMDKKNLRGGDKWPKVLDENLRNSATFLVLMSSEAAQSEWVRHEGSMFLALKRPMIPVKIKSAEKYSSYKLPLWAREFHYCELYMNSPDYDDQLRELMDRLGTPLPIKKHFLQVLEDHQRDPKILLDEVALDLVLAHYHEITSTMPSAQKILADKLIRKSKDKWQRYWDEYDALVRDHQEAMVKIENLEATQRKLIVYGMAFFVVVIAYVYTVLHFMHILGFF